MKDQNKSLKIALLASLGSGLEYYDFVIYGMMAKHLSSVFFPVDGTLSGLIQTFLILVVGYVMRPLGGAVFGMIADNYGRKQSFTIVMLMMAFSTLAIGLLPTYERAGILAPICLALCRILQGISFGAEFPGAATIVSESSPKNGLGALCSFVLSSISLGSVLATYVLFLLNFFFSLEEINNDFWRIPFLLGGVFAIGAYYIRKNIVETPEFLLTQTVMHKRSLLETFKILLLQYWSEILITCGLTLFLATMVIINIYLPIYLQQYFSYGLQDIYRSITFSLLASSIYMIIFGWISDRISKLHLLIFALLGFAVLLFPLYRLLQQKTILSLQLFFLIYQMWISIFFTSYLPIITRLFPTNIRYTGVAVVYNITFSVASTIPVIASYLSEKYQSPLYLGIFFIIAITISLSSLILLIIRNKYKEYVY